MCRSSATVLPGQRGKSRNIVQPKIKGSIRRAEEFSIRRGPGHREVARFIPIGNLALSMSKRISSGLTAVPIPRCYRGLHRVVQISTSTRCTRCFSHRTCKVNDHISAVVRLSTRITHLFSLLMRHRDETTRGIARPSFGRDVSLIQESTNSVHCWPVQFGDEDHDLTPFYGTLAWTTRYMDS